MDKDTCPCPVTTALTIIGGKWKVIILWNLKEGGVKRFGELQRSVEGISQKMLTQELKHLEEYGLINRKVYPVVPPKVEYSLSETGWSLKPLLEHLCEWGKGYRKFREANGMSTAQAPSRRSSREFAKV